MRKLIPIIILLTLTTRVYGQTARGFDWHDKYTYDLYQNAEWDKLIIAGKKANNAGFDYFYLRMRIGIAYYEQGEYRLAIKHFNKALSFNDYDPLAAEYLYYSYKFSGRIMDANIAFKKYQKQLESRNIANPFGLVTGLYTEGGLKFISPSTDEYGPLKYIHVGLQQQLGSRLNLYHGYMRLSQNQYAFETSNPPGMGPPSTIKTTSKYVQNEYFLKATFAIIEGVQLIGSIHPQAISDSIQYNNMAYSLGINSSFNLMDLYFAYGSASIKESQNQQFTAGVTFYPARNQNFYLQSALIYHLTEASNNAIFYQKIGLKTTKNTWFELFGSFGDMQNVQELDGFYIYNTNDHLIRRIGVSGIFLLSQKVKLFAGYTVETYEQIDTQNNYKNHYLFTGLLFLLKN